MSEVTILLFFVSFLIWGYAGGLAIEHKNKKMSDNQGFCNIFYISLLMMVDLLLGIAVILGIDQYEILEGTRWGVFVITEMVLFSFTIRKADYPFGLQVTVTSIFLIAISASVYNSSFVVELIISTLLLFNVINNKDFKVMKFFIPAFFFYMVTTLSYTDSDFLNALLGFIFTVTFYIGVLHLYRADKIKTWLKKMESNKGGTN